MLNIVTRSFLVVILLSTAFLAQAEETGPDRLSGVWVGHERDGSRAGQLTFKTGDRLAYLFDGMSVEGRYEIDFARSPSILVFYPDDYPGKKAYAFIQIKSETEIYVGHLSDTMPADWASQDIITFKRK